MKVWDWEKWRFAKFGGDKGSYGYPVSVSTMSGDYIRLFSRYYFRISF